MRFSATNFMKSLSFIAVCKQAVEAYIQRLIHSILKP
jgi:hypothetical protein